MNIYGTVNKDSNNKKFESGRKNINFSMKWEKLENATKIGNDRQASLVFNGSLKASCFNFSPLFSCRCWFHWSTSLLFLSFLSRDYSNGIFDYTRLSRPCLRSVSGLFIYNLVIYKGGWNSTRSMRLEHGSVASKPFSQLIFLFFSFQVRKFLITLQQILRNRVKRHKHKNCSPCNHFAIQRMNW